MKYRLTFGLLSFAVAAIPAWSAGGPAAHTTATVAEATANETMSEGEVRKIDKDAGKLTLKHGELKNLQMPAMTMVFRVKDPAMLDAVKVGDKVSFVAEKVGGQFTVVKIEPRG